MVLEIIINVMMWFLGIFGEDTATYAYVSAPVESLVFDIEEPTSGHIDEKDAPYIFKYDLTPEEIELCIEITYHEAGAEPEDLQKLIAEVLINRLKSGIWGDTMQDVVFSKYGDGKYEFDTVYLIGTQEIPEKTKRVVYEVLLNGVKIPDRIMYFRTDYYHAWDGAIDEFSCYNVYFSSCIWYGGKK